MTLNRSLGWGLVLAIAATVILLVVGFIAGAGFEVPGVMEMESSSSGGEQTTEFSFNPLAIGSRAGARALGGAVLLLLAAWLVLGTYALGRQLTLQEGDTATIATPVAAVTFTLPALATLLCALYTPSRTVPNDTLAVLPVRPADRNAAIRWLSVGLGVILGGVWVASLAVQFIAAGGGAEAVGALLVCAGLAVAGALTAHAIFLALQLALNRAFGSSDILTTGIAGLVTSLLLLWAMLEALPVQGGTGGGPFTTAGRPLLAVTDGGGLDALRDVALLAGALALVAAVLSGLDRVPRRRSAGLDLRLPFAFRAPRTLISIEARQWLRYPTNAVMLIFTAGLAIASLTLWRGSLDDDNWLLGAFFLFSLISTVGVGRFGPTRPIHWIYHVAGRPLAWVAPKLLSVLALWLGLLCVYGLVLVLLTSWSPDEGLPLLPMLAVEVAAGCVIGLLLPVSREQSLSGALSESVAILVVLSIAIGLQSLPWLDTTPLYLATCTVAAAGLIGLYVALARAPQRDAQGRARLMRHAVDPGVSLDARGVVLALRPALLARSLVPVRAMRLGFTRRHARGGVARVVWHVLAAARLPILAMVLGIGGVALVAGLLAGDPATTLVAAAQGVLVCAASMVCHESAHLLTLRALGRDRALGAIEHSWVNVWIVAPVRRGWQRRLTALAGPVGGVAACVALAAAGVPTWICSAVGLAHAANLFPLAPDGRAVFSR